MSRNVTISTLGPRPIENTGRQNTEALLDAMRTHWSHYLSRVLPDRPDIILLPEACDCYMRATIETQLTYIHESGSRRLDFFREAAAKNNCYIAYSTFLEKEDGTLRNAMLIIDRGGAIAGEYYKNHPTIRDITNRNTMPGKTAPLIQCDFGTLGCAICFDLNFEPLLSHYQKNRPDIILFSSMYHGGIMQNYWAYSCQSHFVSACADLPCTILSPLGELIGESSVHTQHVTRTLNLDCRVVHIDDNMGKIQATREKYRTAISVSEPGLCNLLVISSNSENITSEDIIREFDIETWDDYYKRSLDFQKKHCEQSLDILSGK